MIRSTIIVGSTIDLIEEAKLLLNLKIRRGHIINSKKAATLCTATIAILAICFYCFYRNKLMFDAVYEGRTAEVKILLAIDHNLINAKGKNPQPCPMCVAAAPYHSLLEEAVLRGHRDIVELLISRGFDVNKEDETGNIVLMEAVCRNDRQIVELLIDNGAHVKKANRFGNTPLHFTASYFEKSYAENRAIADLLISRGADVNAANIDGETPMHWAVGNENRYYLLELLISRGADINIKNKKGLSPLKIALGYHHSKIARLLMRHGARE